DLHEITFAQFAGHRSEDTRATRILLVGQNDGGVLVEADVGAILATIHLRRADDHGLDDIAFLYSGVRRGLLHRGNDDVADPGVAPAGASGHQDAHDLFGAGVVGHL